MILLSQTVFSHHSIPKPILSPFTLLPLPLPPSPSLHSSHYAKHPPFLNRHKNPRRRKPPSLPPVAALLNRRLGRHALVMVHRPNQRPLQRREIADGTLRSAGDGGQGGRAGSGEQEEQGVRRRLEGENGGDVRVAEAGSGARCERLVSEG